MAKICICPAKLKIVHISEIEEWACKWHARDWYLENGQEEKAKLLKFEAWGAGDSAGISERIKKLESHPKKK